MGLVFFLLFNFSNTRQQGKFTTHSDLSQADNPPTHLKKRINGTSNNTYQKHISFLFLLLFFFLLFFLFSLIFIKYQTEMPVFCSPGWQWECSAMIRLEN